MNLDFTLPQRDQKPKRAGRQTSYQYAAPLVWNAIFPPISMPAPYHYNSQTSIPTPTTITFFFPYSSPSSPPKTSKPPVSAIAL